MLRLEMLPAEHGDSLLLEYGKGAEITHRSLVDGGSENAYPLVRQRLLQVPAGPDGQRRFELLIMTHVDGDHIEGVVKMLQDDELALSFGDVWFNDWNHFATLGQGPSPTHLGPEAGEFLGALLTDQGRPWNVAFGGAAVMVPQDPSQPLQAWTTPGGLSLTVLSPTVETLVKLRKKWKSAIEAAGFSPGDRAAALRQFQSRRWAHAPKSLGDESERGTLDHSEANGSSIAVLAEFEGHRLLLAADSYADVLRMGLERWLAATGDPGDGRVQLDAFKLPHHGSQKNMTPQLMAVLASDDYLFSSSGRRFRHPDREAVEIVIAGHVRSRPPVLRFNYRSPYTRAWENKEICEARYEADAVVEFLGAAEPVAD